MNDPSPGIRVSAIEGLGRIVLDNLDRMNAMSRTMWEMLSATLVRLAADHAIRCVIIEGAGEKAFCAGPDISNFRETERGAPEVAIALDALAGGTLHEIRAFPKPIIAQIRGYCIGAGVAIATASDLRIAERLFGIPVAKLDVGSDAEGAMRLSALIGPSRAKSGVLYGSS